MKRPSSPIVEDRPTVKDALDFEPYVTALTRIIGSEETGTPLTIGIFGEWGYGKTSLMSMVRERVVEEFAFPVAWFDAWKYDREETLWRALIVQVLNTLRPEEADGEDPFVKELNDLEASLYRAVEREERGEVRIDWGEMAKGAGKAVLHLGFRLIPGAGEVFSELVKEGQKKVAGDDLDKLFGAIQQERHKVYREHVRSLEQFQRKFAGLVDTALQKKGRRLVVFVDDLDRCLPEKAIEVLEAIKLFMDVPGCLFLLGLDDKVIARGIEIKYRELGQAEAATEDGRPLYVIEGTRYLEKIIQVPFRIPRIAPEVMGDFVEGLVATWPHEECPRVFARGMGESPRQVKRTVNTFLLLWELAQAREQQEIKPIRLAKVVAIQQIAPLLYDVLRERPGLLRDLEAYYRADESRAGGRADLGSPDEALPRERAEEISVELPPGLDAFVGRPALRRVLTLHGADVPDANFADLSPEALRVYFTLTRRAQAPELGAPEERRMTLESHVVPVPAGSFMMGSSEEQLKDVLARGFDKVVAGWEQPRHTVELSVYSIGKYPVTNVEYQAFVRESRHRPPSGWDGDTYPEEKSDHPVVGVSWGDATAYCTWLSEKTGKDYRLPTEAQWEKAARGADGLIYPWGNAWDSERVNSAEGGRGDTSPVGQYSPGGDSPYGAADMAGNVWEWCADWFDQAAYERRRDTVIRDPQGPDQGDTRVLRGGSFYYSDHYVRCAARYYNFPFLRNYSVGFRIVLLP